MEPAPHRGRADLVQGAGGAHRDPLREAEPAGSIHPRERGSQGSVQGVPHDKGLPAGVRVSEDRGVGPRRGAVLALQAEAAPADTQPRDASADRELRPRPRAAAARGEVLFVAWPERARHRSGDIPAGGDLPRLDGQPGSDRQHEQRRAQHPAARGEAAGPALPQQVRCDDREGPVHHELEVQRHHGVHRGLDGAGAGRVRGDAHHEEQSAGHLRSAQGLHQAAHHPEEQASGQGRVREGAQELREGALCGDQGGGQEHTQHGQGHQQGVARVERL
mmetsp:Transcript_18177/g.40317  ORF Transcript_18177/g.40317 Transcript_18177/m.40317 type:complete len:276 (-) Transcript_18177:3207-4034(-)